jgi:hypothetical protein
MTPRRRGAKKKARLLSRLRKKGEGARQPDCSKL